MDIWKWEDIKERYQRGCLLLGNGSSMAIHSGFSYKSLRSAANELGHLQKAAPLFDAFNTADFELVLRLLWHASLVNGVLNAPAPVVKEAYETVRSALIQTVRATHLAHSEVRDGPFTEAADSVLLTMNAFLASFQLVVSLNYDLLVYWARMAAKSSSRDCFGKEGDSLVFQGLPESLEEKISYVLYPHGNLCLARTQFGDEIKLKGRNANLLDQVLESWESGNYGPLFVSEGTTDQKMRSIRSSAYLSASLAGIRKQTEGNSLVLYGWGMGEHDQHIVDALASRRPSRVAVSVFRPTRENCEDLLVKVDRLFGVKADLFDAESAGPWSRRSAELAAAKL